MKKQLHLLIALLLFTTGAWAQIPTIINSGNSPLTVAIADIETQGQIITVQSGGELIITGLTVNLGSYTNPGLTTLANYVVRESGGIVKAIIPGKVGEDRQWYRPSNATAGILTHLLGDDESAYVTFGQTSTVFEGLDMDLDGGEANQLDLNLGSLTGAGTLDNIQVLSAIVSRSGTYRNELTFDLGGVLPNLTTLAIRPLSSNTANTTGNPIITGDGKNNPTVLNAPSELRWAVPLSIATSGPEFGTVYFRHATPANAELTFETRVATSTYNPSPSGGSWNNRELKLIEVMDIETGKLTFDLTNLVDDGTISGLPTNGQGYTILNQLLGTIQELVFTGTGNMELNGTLPGDLASNIKLDENFEGWLEVADPAVTSVANGKKEDGKWTYFEFPVNLYREDALVGQFETIQPAIDAAIAGDVIEVAAGDYPEDITINVAGLTLNGAGRDLTKIIGQGTGETEAVRIQADNVTVDGFEIQGNKKPVRIPIPTTGVSFVNNRIVTGDNATSQNAWVGFEVYWDKEQTDLVIDNNIFVANKTAQLVYLNKANNIQFTNNQIEGEMRPDGLTLGLGGLNGDQDISGNTFDTFTSYALLEVDGTFDILNLLSDNSWPQGGVAGGNKVHNTIQAAINAATAGDVIHVSAGEYNEDLLVNKSVSIHGAGADQTIFTNRVRLAGSFVDVSFKDFTLTRNTAPMLTAEYGNPSFDGVTFENVDFVFTGVSTNPSQGGRRAITLGFGIDATIVGNGLTFKDAIFESTNPDELSAPIMVLRADGGAHPAGPLTFDNVTVKGNGNYNAINTYDGGHVTVKNSKTEVSGAFYLSGFSELTVNENEFTGKGGVFINGVGTGATITGNTFKDIPTGGDRKSVV